MRFPILAILIQLVRPMMDVREYAHLFLLPSRLGRSMTQMTQMPGIWSMRRILWSLALPTHHLMRAPLCVLPTLLLRQSDQ